MVQFIYDLRIDIHFSRAMEVGLKKSVQESAPNDESVNTIRG
jgi:hypothetical protein